MKMVLQNVQNSRVMTKVGNRLVSDKFYWIFNIFLLTRQLDNIVRFVKVKTLIILSRQTSPLYDPPHKSQFFFICIATHLFCTMIYMHKLWLLQQEVEIFYKLIIYYLRRRTSTAAKILLETVSFTAVQPALLTWLDNSKAQIFHFTKPDIIHYTLYELYAYEHRLAGSPTSLANGA